MIVSIIQGKTWIVDDSLPSVRFLLGIVLYIWTQSRLAPKTSQVSKTAPAKKHNKRSSADEQPNEAKHH